MGSKQCYEILASIKKVMQGISFEDDVRLKQELDMTVNCDQKRLNELRAERRRRQEEMNDEEESVVALRAKLKRVQDEKEKVRKTITDLEKIESQGLPPENNEDFIKYKKLLNVYMEVTGTRAIYKCQENTVRGFVGLKGSTPGESKLLPFDFETTDPAISDKIWERIVQACTRDQDLELAALELSKMQIE